MVRVFISFATEDFASPIHDEILLRIASILRARGIVGGFHLTGDLARTLRRRRRQDIIAALGEHEIGYHGNTHGAAPFLAEVCERGPWDAAVRRIVADESRGLLDLRETFGRAPSYYVLEFVKAPELVHAIRCLGIDTVGFSSVPVRDAPFAWYAGSLCYGGLHMGVESPPDAPDRLRQLRAQFDGLLDRARAGEGGGVIKLFNHPYKFAAPAGNAWPSVNRLYREYDLHKEWIAPPVYDTPTMERLYAEFEALLDHALSRDDVTFSHTGALADAWRAEPPRFVPIDTVRFLARREREELDAVIHAGASYSPAEILGLIADALALRETTGRMPEEVPFRKLLGPVERIPADAHGLSIPRAAVLAALPAAMREIDFHGRIPARLSFGGQSVHAGSLLRGLAGLLVRLSENPGSPPDPVSFPPTPPFPRAAGEPFFEEETWTREIYPEGFEGRNLCRSCRRQSWSYKPAVPR